MKQKTNFDSLINITFPRNTMPNFYQLKTIQKMPISLDQAWDFFKSPLNLAKITPEHMGFQITSDPENAREMYAGQIITYKVSPVPGIKINWMTEITQVADKKFFIDEQRFGPYAMWHHQHHFKAIPGGVEMIDIVDYVLPLGFLGAIAHWLFVKKQLKGIFDFRTVAVDKLFGKYDFNSANGSE
jgi:ligand-binding SRPBCC domain-containing protein